MNISDSILPHGSGYGLQRLEKLPEDLRQDVQDRQLREKCQEFESLLFYQMLKTMRSTIQKTGLMDGGHAEDTMTALLDQEYSVMMSKNSRSDLSEALYNEMKTKNNVNYNDKIQIQEGVYKLQRNKR